MFVKSCKDLLFEEEVEETSKMITYSIERSQPEIVRILRIRPAVDYKLTQTRCRRRHATHEVSLYLYPIDILGPLYNNQVVS